jgi:hypothetical protein
VTGPEPSETAGINVLRLDADQTRDELAERLGEIQDRLTPRELVRSASLTISENRRQFMLAAGGVLLATAGVIALVVTRRRRG